MYRITYGAAKTKVTVVGSEIDRKYFHDVKPWTMDNSTVLVVEDNEHLGQVVSGKNKEQKNVDLKKEERPCTAYWVQHSLSSVFSVLY